MWHYFLYQRNQNCLSRIKELTIKNHCSVKTKNKQSFFQYGPIVNVNSKSPFVPNTYILLILSFFPFSEPRWYKVLQAFQQQKSLYSGLNMVSKSYSPYMYRDRIEKKKVSFNACGSEIATTVQIHRSIPFMAIQ